MSEEQTTTIMGIEVKFPFRPYPLQLAYMSQVLRCLKKRENGLLESPTGTGKTLSLLCSSLAWINKEKELYKQLIDFDNYQNYQNPELVKIHPRTGSQNADDNFGSTSSSKGGIRTQVRLGPQIYFSSRTHAQLSQSIKEMKKSAYRQNTAVVLGSRDQLCLNPDVNCLESNAAKNAACRAKVKSKVGPGCPYHREYETKIQNEPDYINRAIFDIEDLIELGQKHTCCPYYAARRLQPNSDMVFLPYNYLLDPDIRKRQDIELQDAVAIFDEGHNIEKVCEEAISTAIRSEQIALVLRDLQRIYKEMKKVHEGDITNENMQLMDSLINIPEEDLATFCAILLDVEKEIDAVVARFQAKQTEYVNEDYWIFNMLSRCNLVPKKYSGIMLLLEMISNMLSIAVRDKTFDQSSIVAFDKVREFIQILFPSDSKMEYEQFKHEFTQRFKTCIMVDLGARNKQGSKASSDWTIALEKPAEAKTKSWTLHVWCLTPSIGMKSLLDKQLRNIIITSGTLAPMDSFEVEFGIPFPVKLENQHIIAPTQMRIFPITHSPDGEQLNSKYDNKDNNKYYMGLGDTVVRICKKVPDGVLIFFSSYAVLNNTLTRWKSSGIFNQLKRKKDVYEELRGSRGSFADSIETFRHSVDSKRGAIYIGVCRGKLSEGLDLSNQYCRAVIMIGLPFPAVMDKRVQLKKAYIDSLKISNLNSSVWYTLQMKRALNQAVGRAIRNRNDYGCVFLLDFRYQASINDLSKWCRRFFVHNICFQDVIDGLDAFFYNNKGLKQAIRTIEPAKCADDTENRSENKRRLPSEEDSNDDDQILLNSYASASASTAAENNKRHKKNQMFTAPILNLKPKKTEASSSGGGDVVRSSLFDRLYQQAGKIEATTRIQKADTKASMHNYIHLDSD